MNVESGLRRNKLKFRNAWESTKFLRSSITNSLMLSKMLNGICLEPPKSLSKSFRCNQVPWTRRRNAWLSKWKWTKKLSTKKLKDSWAQSENSIRTTTQKNTCSTRRKLIATIRRSCSSSNNQGSTTRESSLWAKKLQTIAHCKRCRKISNLTLPSGSQLDSGTLNTTSG